MGKELVVAEAAEEQAADEAGGALDADSYIDVEIIEEDGPSADTLLDDADAAALEEGIASVFGRLRAETEGGDETSEADAADSTFALLEELNRLWAQAASA